MKAAPARTGPGAPPRRGVLLVVPNIGRDLPGLVLVGNQLSTRFGHSPMFCQPYELDEIIRERRPAVVLFDQLGTGTRARQALLARSVGARVLVLPTAGFLHDPAAEARRAGVEFGSDRLVDRYLAWGPYGRDLLVEQGVLAAAQIAVVGCPRFDFYHPSYHALGTSRDEVLAAAGLAPCERLIVWTTATYYERSASSTQRGDGIADHESADIHDERVQTEQLSHVLMDLALRHPEWGFLIKVHPCEREDPYRELARARPNIASTTSIAINSAILRCDALLQHSSTTAVEAWFTDLPVIEVTSSEYRIPSRPEYLRGCDVCSDAAAVSEALQRHFHSGTIPAEQRAAREAFHAELCTGGDGRSAERCAAAIHDALRQPPRAIVGESRQSELPRAGRRATLRRLRRRVPRWLGGQRGIVDVALAREVEHLLGALRRMGPSEGGST